MTDSHLNPLAQPSDPRSALPLPLEEARERAVRLLSDGYAYDAISEAEFEWRLARLHQTDSLAAVNALVADLAVPRSATLASYGDTTPAAEERIVAVMSETHREGRWLAPNRLRVLAVMSEVRIDLRDAIIPNPCLIEVRAVMAKVTVTVPPGVAVDFDVTPVMGSARNRASKPGTLGAPFARVAIRGSAVMAEVGARLRERLR